MTSIGYMHIQRTIDYFTKVIEMDDFVIENQLNLKESKDNTLTIEFHEHQIKLHSIEK